jgi:hypothetical protein
MRTCTVQLLVSMMLSANDSLTQITQLIPPSATLTRQKSKVASRDRLLHRLLPMATVSHTAPLSPTKIDLPPAVPQPTLDEMYRAIPPEGVEVVQFAAWFNRRTSGDEKFKTLMLLARTVATLDVENSVLLRQVRPTEKEIRDAIPPEGIEFERLLDLVGYTQLSSDNQDRVARFLDQIATPDLATWRIRLKGRLTLEEILAAIPDDGITPAGLYQKFEARFASDDQEFYQFYKNLSKVAIWDVQNGNYIRGNLPMKSDQS